MGTFDLPSLIWGNPFTPPAVDRALSQDAGFKANSLYRAYLDSQILGLETHLARLLLGGLNGTWRRIDGQSAAIAVGQWVCLAGRDDLSVTLATGTAVAAAGQPLGVALVAGAPGSWVYLAMTGAVSRLVTGLAENGNDVYACLNTVTGYTQTKTSLGSNDYPVGTVDGAGTLTVHVQLPPVSGGGGAISISGTGVALVAGGVIQPAAGPIDLSSSTYVSNVVAWVNGGRLQGAIDVTHSAPGTLTATVQIARCDSGTGTTVVTLYGSPADNFEALILDTGGAAATSAITVHPNGKNVWSPDAGAFGASDLALRGNGAVLWLKFDANKNHWLVLSGASLLTSRDPGATITGAATLGATDFWKKVAAGAVVTMPAAPILGAEYALTPVSGTLESNPVTVSGNSYNVWDPNPVNPYDNAVSVTMRVSAQSAKWRWDGTAMVLV